MRYDVIFKLLDQTADAPCVGMCYYKKVMGLEEKENNDDKSHNEVIEVNLAISVTDDVTN